MVPDLAAGAQFKSGLLWVVGLASLMAIFMQIIAARFGVATGKDLAHLPREIVDHAARLNPVHPSARHER